jgi:hypothetical protein
MAENTKPSDDEILEAMRSTIFARHADVLDGVAKAAAYLEQQGMPLTLLQREVIFFTVVGSHRQASDTWDHQIENDHSKDAAWPRACTLLHRIRDENDC